MEVRQSSFTAAATLPLAADAVVGLCFHPVKPVAYVATAAHILAVDLVTGCVEGRVCCSAHGRLEQLLHVAVPDMLCALFDGGAVVAYDAATLAQCAATVPEREEDRRPAAACAASSQDPFVFVVGGSGRNITALDLESRATFKLRGNKKAVVALATHPAQPILAAATGDGEVRLWDYESQTLVCALENALPPAPRYLLR